MIKVALEVVNLQE